MTRQRQWRLAALATVCTVAMAPPAAQAHHSHGNYADTFTDLEGVVREVHLVNPHSWIYIEVKGPDGRPLRWSLEASSRNALERIGVTAGYLKPGDNIKVRCHPLRDGSRACLLGFVKAPDGSVKDWDASNVPLPADF
jgi:hypothetical protein